MKPLKQIIIIILCFGLSLTERFTHASIPLVINYMGLSSIELSAFFTAMAASMVFTGLVVAPYIDTHKRKFYFGCLAALGGWAGLSFLMFDLTQGLVWGCLLMFCTGAILRIINLRRLSVVNREISKKKLSLAHTQMQLTIVIAMVIAPISLAYLAPDFYLVVIVCLLGACCLLSVFTSAMPVTPHRSTEAVIDGYEKKELVSAHHFIFVGMLLSGIFISNLLVYCQSISDQSTQLYAYVVFWQMVGLLIGNMVFERFFGDRFKNYGVLVAVLVVAESAFILMRDPFLICMNAVVIGASFQLMFLKSHNQFQRQIPLGLTARLNGVRGLYTFVGVTVGYMAGPVLHHVGGLSLVFMSCSAIALLLFIFVGYLNGTRKS